MRTSYPRQINSIVHKNREVTKTFGMDAKLYSPKKEDELRTPAAPLEMHEGYSVFKGTLIEKTSKDTKFVTFNIPAKAVPYIHKKTVLAMDSNFKVSTFNSFINRILTKIDKILSFVGKTSEEIEENIDIENTIAYKTKFISGTLKGKSPIDVLMESEIGKDTLLKQKKFLESNLSKYKSNQTLIDAIDEAIKLQDKGLLKKTENETVSVAPNVIKLYESAPKNIKPLDEEGRYTIYQVTVQYNPNMRMPINISVMNCFAPVDKKDGNKIEMTKAVNKQTIDMNLTEEEWFTMIDEMKAMKIMFENLTYPEQLKLANEIERLNMTEKA